MAIQKNGPNGPFYGKAGSVVGSRWKGIDYLRSIPKKRKSPPTEDEAANRTKFGFTQRWISQLSDFISVGFLNFSPRMTAYNAAMSWNSKNAVKGTAPDFEVDYPSVLLSDGPLQEATDPEIFVADGKMVVSWKTVYRRKAKASDELLFIAYCPEKEESLFSIADAKRSDKIFQAEIPEELKGEQVEVFIAFCSRDRKIASRSQYLGKLLLPNT